MQLIKKFPAFYGTRKFITVPTSARHLSLSWANSIQSPQPFPTSWRSILILSSHLGLGLPNGLFPSGFPTSSDSNSYSVVTQASAVRIWYHMGRQDWQITERNVTSFTSNTRSLLVQCSGYIKSWCIQRNTKNCVLYLSCHSLYCTTAVHDWIFSNSF